MLVAISYRGQKRELELDEETTLDELMAMIEQETDVPSEMQKLIAPKVGAVKLDSHSGEKLIGDIFPEESRTKIMLVGTPMSQIQALQRAEQEAGERQRRYRQRLQNRLLNGRRPAKTRQVKPEYTFGKLEPLRSLPHSERALEYLERIQNDKGVQAVMAKHKWNVGVLTELDPASSTTHDQRLLGLNVGKGAIIKLRIRTDDYQGFCEYKQVIKVLCHELAHNVHGEHDRQFWDLTNQLEKEVIELDPFGGKGYKLSNQEFFDPEKSLGTGHAQSLHVDEGNSSSGAPAGHVVGTSSSNTSASGDESMQAKIRRAAEQRKRDT